MSSKILDLALYCFCCTHYKLNLFMSVHFKLFFFHCLFVLLKKKHQLNVVCGERKHNQKQPPCNMLHTALLFTCHQVQSKMEATPNQVIPALKENSPDVEASDLTVAMVALDMVIESNKVIYQFSLASMMFH